MGKTEATVSELEKEWRRILLEVENDNHDFKIAAAQLNRFTEDLHYLIDRNYLRPIFKDGVDAVQLTSKGKDFILKVFSKQYEKKDAKW